MFNTRIRRLQNCMSDKGVSAVAINAGPSLTYLTGLHFHLMERPVVTVITENNESAIIFPQLEQAKLDHLNFPAKTYSYGENPAEWGQVFCDAMHGLELSGQKIGVEPRQMRLLEYDYLRLACDGAVFIDGSEIFSSLRSIKDKEEISCMRRAVKIAEDALEATLPHVKIGVSEKEIAGELFLQLIRHGSETSLPFSPIVATGPNGANPHSQPSDRKLATGDLLVIDWGARYGGYASDITRTFGVSEIDEKAERMHKLVQQANRAGREAGKVGVACSTVDKAARSIIETAGYGQYFTHRTGHGIGMECHEEPYIHGDNGQQLEVGMTYTVEPGIYLPGRNGVRIEDDVLITPGGAESLSTMSRELRLVGE